jgi:cytochrome c556
MRQYLQIGAAAAAIALAVGFGTATTMAEDLAAVVKDRQAAMKQQSDDLKVIKAYLDGGGDQAAAVAKAKDMLAVVDKIGPLWPAGTSSKDMPGKSNAKPEIWQDMAKFTAIQTTLKTGDQTLLDALTKGDKAAATAAFGDLGKNGCGACHGTFREKLS